MSLYIFNISQSVYVPKLGQLVGVGAGVTVGVGAVVGVGVSVTITVLVIVTISENVVPADKKVMHFVPIHFSKKKRKECFRESDIMLLDVT